MVSNSPKKTRKPHASWSRRKEARPEEILVAAMNLFGKYGYATCRMEDIAKEAGLTKGALYLYYENKEELLGAVVSSVLVPLIEELARVKPKLEGEASNLLHQLLCSWYELMRDNEGLSIIPKLIFVEARNFPDIARSYYQNVLMRASDVVAEVLEYGKERGEFAFDNSKLRASFLISPLVFKLLWKNSFEPFEESPVSLEVWFEEYLKSVFYGLKNN